MLLGKSMKNQWVILAVMASMLSCSAAEEVKFSGVVGGELRAFMQEATFEQDNAGLSGFVEPEWYFQFEDSTFTFKPYLRLDSMDSERSHFDIREAYWQTVGDEWSLTLGINKVFWGVAESQHLVDIINQTDAVENVDGEDKLGQPMINFNFEKDWGTLALFVLPGFRDRTFAGEDGRLRLELMIDSDNPLYESSAKKNHTDVAARFSKTIDEWDLGLSYFKGTSREPLFVFNPISGKLQPYYPQISQFGIDAQATLEEWLLKLEAIYRTDFGNEDYLALVTGFEYTFYGIMDSATDLGWVLEYQYDERDSLGGLKLSDVLLSGARFAFNDVQSTDLLVGIGFETETDVKFFSIEGARRIGDDMKLSVEGRLFRGIDQNNPNDSIFYSFRNDDFIQVTLEKFF